MKLLHIQQRSIVWVMQSDGVRHLSQITKYGWRVGNYCDYLSMDFIEQLLNSGLDLLLKWMFYSVCSNEDQTKNIDNLILEWQRWMECCATHLILIIPFPRKFHTFLIIPPCTALSYLQNLTPVHKSCFLGNWSFQKLQILYWQLIGLKFDIKSWVNFENNAEAAV